MLLYCDYIVFTSYKDREYKNIGKKNCFIPMKLPIKYNIQIGFNFNGLNPLKILRELEKKFTRLCH